MERRAAADARLDQGGGRTARARTRPSCGSTSSTPARSSTPSGTPCSLKVSISTASPRRRRAVDWDDHMSPQQTSRFVLKASSVRCRVFVNGFYKGTGCLVGPGLVLDRVARRRRRRPGPAAGPGSSDHGPALRREHARGERASAVRVALQPRGVRAAGASGRRRGGGRARRRPADAQEPGRPAPRLRAAAAPGTARQVAQHGDPRPLPRGTGPGSGLRSRPRRSAT